MLIVRDNPNQPSKAEKINSQKVRMFTVKNGTLYFFVFSFGGRVAEQVIFLGPEGVHFFMEPATHSHYITPLLSLHTFLFFWSQR